MDQLDHRSRELRSTLRMDARLDSRTRQKVDDLAQHFHQPRAAVLCHIMQWGLNREHTETLDQGKSQGPVRHFYLYVTSELHARVEKALTAAGVKIAPWLRHLVRQIAVSDFPASWQEERLDERSHDSHTYGTRFMLRLDEYTQTKLQRLVNQFGGSKAEIIRQLIAQAEPEDFPPSWHMRAAERRAQQIKEKGMGNVPNMAMTDADGEVAVIDLQRHGREFHLKNVLGLSGLQTSSVSTLAARV